MKKRLLCLAIGLLFTTGCNNKASSSSDQSASIEASDSETSSLSSESQSSLTSTDSSSSIDESGIIKETKTSEGLVFSETSDYAILSSFYDYGKSELIIPSKFNGKPVVYVGSCASLFDKDFEFPITYDDVKNASNSESSLASLMLKSNSKIKSITIPDSVIGLGDGSFLGLTGLESITLSKNLIDIGSYAFAFNLSLTSINLPSNLRTIGELAFTYTGLGDLVLPSSVKYAPSDSYSYINPDRYMNVIFSSEVSYMMTEGYYADYYSSLEDYSAYPTMILNGYSLASNDIWSYAYKGNEAVLLHYIGKETSEIRIPSTVDGKKVTIVGKGIFADVKGNIGRLVIENGTYMIASDAFTKRPYFFEKDSEENGGLYTIDEIYIDKEEAYGDYWFGNDYSHEEYKCLNDIVLADGMVTFGPNCKKVGNLLDRTFIKEAELPKTIESVNSSLGRTKHLYVEYAYDEVPTDWGIYTNGTIYYGATLKSRIIIQGIEYLIHTYKMEDGSTAGYAEVIGVENASTITSLEIPDKITRDGVEHEVLLLGERSLQSCTSLTTLKLPDSLQLISRYALYGLENLSNFELDLPNLKYINYGAFYNVPIKKLVLNNALNYANGLFGIVEELVVECENDDIFKDCDFGFYPNAKITIKNTCLSLGRNFWYSIDFLNDIPSVTIEIEDVLSTSIESNYYNFEGICSHLTLSLPYSEFSIDFLKENNRLSEGFIDLMQKVKEVKYGTKTIEGLVSFQGINYLINDYETEDGSKISYAKVIGVENASTLTSLEIPEKITDGATEYEVWVLGNYSLKSCTSLTTLKLPNSLRGIDEYALVGLKNLSDFELDLPNLVYVYNYNYYGYTAHPMIKRLVLNNTLKKIQGVFSIGEELVIEKDPVAGLSDAHENLLFFFNSNSKITVKDTCPSLSDEFWTVLVASLANYNSPVTIEIEDVLKTSIDKLTYYSSLATISLSYTKETIETLCQEGRLSENFIALIKNENVKVEYGTKTIEQAQTTL